jgi:hypothetical protein
MFKRGELLFLYLTLGLFLLSNAAKTDLGIRAEFLLRIQGERNHSFFGLAQALEYVT